MNGFIDSMLGSNLHVPRPERIEGTSNQHINAQVGRGSNEGLSEAIVTAIGASHDTGKIDLIENGEGLLDKKKDRLDEAEDLNTYPVR